MHRNQHINQPPPALNSILFIVLRRMRAPLIMVIAAYTIAIFGLTLIPGLNAHGQPGGPPMSYFHAFYFISFTATTTGYGEYPQTFSDAQRMWVIFCIYLTVISWAYNILTVFTLLQDKAFRNAFARIGFTRRVHHIREPFYLVCGCGETGELVSGTLDRRNQRFVIVEQSEERVQELTQMPWQSNPPILNADARLPDNLLAAGLAHAHCQGVLALSRDEEANLAVAIAVRLLHPDIPILAAVRSAGTAVKMESFGADHIINPFEIFAARLALVMRAPKAFLLARWLTGIPGEPLPESYYPPRGNWIACGFGRFGQAVVHTLEAEGQSITLVEPRTDISVGHRPHIVNQGTEVEPLLAAGVRDAVGIVAGTDSDVNNLSIAVTARKLNPDIFVVMRQNLAANDVLFEAFEGDFALVTSQLIAEECLATLNTPLLVRFLKRLTQENDAWAEPVLAQLEAVCEERLPHVWPIRINRTEAPAALNHLVAGKPLDIAYLLRDPNERDKTLNALPLLLVRDGKDWPMPDVSMALQPGDALLFAGRLNARNSQFLSVQNSNVLDYILTGYEAPGGWVWHRWARSKLAAEEKR